MTNTKDLEAISPARVALAVKYNLGLVDILAAQILQTERAMLTISPITRRLMLNALMHYRRALDGDGEDIGVPIIDERQGGVHPLLDDHLQERARYLKGEILAEQSRDQGRALGRAERRAEIEKLQDKIDGLEAEANKAKNGKTRRARVKR